MSELSNKQNLGLHLGAGAADGYLLEGNAILDTTRNKSVQASIDYLYEHGGGGGGTSDFTWKGDISANQFDVYTKEGSEGRVKVHDVYRVIDNVYYAGSNYPAGTCFYASSVASLVTWKSLGGRFDKELEDFVRNKLAGYTTSRGEYSSSINVIPGVGAEVTFEFDFADERSIQPVIQLFNIKDPDNPIELVNNVEEFTIVYRIAEYAEEHISKFKCGQRTPVFHGAGSISWFIDFRTDNVNIFAKYPTQVRIVPEAIEIDTPIDERTFDQSKLICDIDAQAIIIYNDLQYSPSSNSFTMNMPTISGITSYTNEINKNIKLFVEDKYTNNLYINSIIIATIGGFSFIKFKFKDDAGSYVTSLSNKSLKNGLSELCFENRPYYGLSEEDKHLLVPGTDYRYVLLINYTFGAETRTVKINIVQHVADSLEDKDLTINEIYKALTIQ